MFKRVRWIGVGALLGAGGSVYAQLKVRRTAERYLSPEVTARVAGGARRLGREVHDALAEGREAMTEREAELRARVPPPSARRDVRDAASRPAPIREGRPGLRALPGGAERADGRRPVRDRRAGRG